MQNWQKTLSDHELEQLHGQLWDAQIGLRLVNHYGVANLVKMVARTINDELLVRQLASQDHLVRQLSLLPRGTYEPPSESA